MPTIIYVPQMSSAFGMTARDYWEDQAKRHKRRAADAANAVEREAWEAEAAYCVARAQSTR